MHSDLTAAGRYLEPAPDAFWEWENSDELVRWRSGELIAFRAEIAGVVRYLAPRGLPPFDSLVLFLAACRQHRAIDAAQLEQRKVLPMPLQEGRSRQAAATGVVDRLVSVLDAIAELPLALRDSVERKSVLAWQIFESCGTAVPYETAQRVLEFLERGVAWEFFASKQGPLVADRVERLAPLAAGARGWITSEQLALRSSTGLEQLPGPIPADEEQTESLRSLLARLEQDEELGGLARLTRNLAAALALPRRVSEPQDLPLGGVSDISNRGSLDRLLVSELAQDDLTFTVRVALSEALYLRREAPPYVPPRQRTILIDSGFRMWGLPRVYATAAALALALSRERDFEVALYRPHGTKVDRVDVGTRDGLVQHLGALEVDIHPGAALPAFFELVGEPEHGAEAVLVTCEDVLADPAFRSALNEQAPAELYLVTAERHGAVRLYRRTPQGTKLLREVSCSLEDVFPQTPTAPPLVDKSVDPALPAILRLAEFPLRLPHPVKPESIWGDRHGGVLARASDGRIMHWDVPGAGARQRLCTLPRGRLLWHSILPNSEWGQSAVVGRLSQTGLCLVHIPVPDGPCRSFPLTLAGKAPRGVAAHGGAIVVIFTDHVEAFSEATGELAASIDMPVRCWWNRDRFFRVPDGFHALCFDGKQLEFVPACAYTSMSRSWPLVVWDLSYLGNDGPATVTLGGEVFRLDRSIVMPPTGNSADPGSELLVAAPRELGGYSVRGIAPDGSRIVLSSNSRPADKEQDWFLLDLKERTCEKTPLRNAESILKSHVTARITSFMLRTKFSAIYSDGEALHLVAKHGRAHCRIMWSAEKNRILLRTQAPTPGAAVVPFVDAVAPAGVGYRLQRATWQDGSRAYLDSRGLLHLVSSDSSISELTLVLNENEVAGWCSSGGTWGSKYFEIKPPGMTPEIAFEVVLRRFLRRLR